jgi:hypothetical protein
MLSGYIDGALGQKDQHFVEQHLGACEDCPKELESLHMTVRMLKRVPVVDVPRSFAITGAEERGRITFAPQNMGWLRPATALATAVFLVVLVLDLLPVLSTEVADRGELLAGTPSPVTTAPAEGQELDTAPGRDAFEQTTPGAAPVPGVEAPTGEGAIGGPEAAVGEEDARAAEEGGEGWPFRVVEIGAGVVALALVAALLFTRRQRRKWKGV